MFELKLSDPEWLGEPESDLCSHGKIFLKVGDTVISDETDSSWVLHEAALLLMWTVKYGTPFERWPKYYGGSGAGFLINCCGLLYMFCSSGIEWEVELDGDLVHLSGFLKYEAGKEDNSAEDLHVTVALAEYAQAIHAFAVDVLKFHEGVEKNYDERDEYFPGQIEAFWREYHELLSYIGEVKGA